MRLTSFGHFWVLVLLGPIRAKDDFIFNSTRAASGTLWTMALNDNDVYRIIFLKLRQYALQCCEANYGYVLDGCGSRQIAFWASIGKNELDNLTNNKDALNKWLDRHYNPASADNPTNPRQICIEGNNANEPYPNFAIMLDPNSDSNVGHTENILIRPMWNKVEQYNREKTQAHFFLYTFNSPCTISHNQELNCQKDIFDFTAYQLYEYDETYGEYRPYHTMAVGLYQWYVGKTSTIRTARENFCKSVTALKEDDDYAAVDFFDGLYFKKILNQPKQPNPNQQDDIEYQRNMFNLGQC